MKKLNSKGFGTLEVILIIVIAGVIGGVGWYVWSSRNKANTALNNANSASNPTKLESIKTFNDCKKAKGSKLQETYPEVCVTSTGKEFTNPNQNVTNTPQTSTNYEKIDKYLEIKEWGINIQLSSTTQDAYYVMHDGYVYLSLISLKGTGCAADKVSTGALSREPKDGTDQLSGVPFAEQGTVLGQYSYIFTPPQAGCSDNSQIQQKASDAQASFMQDSKTVSSY